MGKNSKTALFTLTLLETCVKNCDRQFRVLVCSHQFVEDLLGLGAPGAVREQMLGMLQSWALAFRADPGMSGVVETVAEMRARGVPFPEPTTQDIILTSHQVQGVPKQLQRFKIKVKSLECFLRTPCTS